MQMSTQRRFWMVRAGFKNALANDVEKHNAVAIGWPELGDLSRFNTFDDLRTAYRMLYPNDNAQRISVMATQLYRFAQEINIDDYVITSAITSVAPLKTFLVGEIEGEYQHDPTKFSAEYPHTRKVKWLGEVQRDKLTRGAQRSLGSILTVFNVDKHSEDILRLLRS